MPYSRVVYYVSAHPDDWQLFRGEQAYYDLYALGVKVVFIYLTAGDAGMTNGWWEVREASAVASLRPALVPSPLLIDVRCFNQHPIVRYRCGNSVSYFLRLADGGRDGLGFAATDNTSLSYLRDVGKPIRAVDGSTEYLSWSDLCLTLQYILEAEAEDIPQEHPWINLPDFDSQYSPGDHADHTATSDAINTFAAGRFNRSFWVGYDTQNRASNLSHLNYYRKGKMFDAYRRKVQELLTANGQSVNQAFFETEWINWGSRSYSRGVAWDQ